ncbi:MAG: hypothetical protein WCI12_07950 [Actinomycetes bacterium]
MSEYFLRSISLMNPHRKRLIVPGSNNGRLGGFSNVPDRVLSAVNTVIDPG